MEGNMTSTKSTPSIKPYKGCAKCREYRHQPASLRMHVMRTHTGVIRTPHQHKRRFDPEVAGTTTDNGVLVKNGAPRPKKQAKRAYTKRKVTHKTTVVPDLLCQRCPRCGTDIVAVTIAMQASEAK